MALQTIVEPRDVRDAFATFPSGVAALGAVVGDQPTVLIASSFTVGVSQDPPLVLFAVQHSSTTWPVLATAPVIGVSVLGEDHAQKLRQLASADRSRRFDGVGVSVDDGGALYLDGSPAALECTTEAVHPAGDHDIVVLRVHRIETDAERHPLVWYRSRTATMAAEVA
jgi:flavin reductase (DIM6/NTAB) family NADH-FMN oxidoreductase RutF